MKYIIKADLTGLVKQKVPVHRGSKTYMAYRYVSPPEFFDTEDPKFLDDYYNNLEKFADFYKIQKGPTKLFYVTDRAGDFLHVAIGSGRLLPKIEGSPLRFANVDIPNNRFPNAPYKNMIYSGHKIVEVTSGTVVYDGFEGPDSDAVEFIKEKIIHNTYVLQEISKKRFVLENGEEKVNRPTIASGVDVKINEGVFVQEDAEETEEEFLKRVFENNFPINVDICPDEYNLYVTWQRTHQTADLPVKDVRDVGKINWVGKEVPATYFLNYYNNSQIKDFGVRNLSKDFNKLKNEEFIRGADYFTGVGSEVDDVGGQKDFVADKTQRAWAAESNDSGGLQDLLQQEAYERLNDQVKKLAQVTEGMEEIRSINEQVSEDVKKLAQVTYDSIYSRTQEWFEAMGYKPEDEINVFRGTNYNFVSNNETIAEAPGTVIPNDKFKTRPLSSWSLNPAVARVFSGRQGVILNTKVKIKDIFSVYSTGFGCHDEAEVIVKRDAYSAGVKPIYVGDRSIEEMKYAKIKMLLNKYHKIRKEKILGKNK